MPPATTRPRATRVPSTLSLAFELGNAEWKLAMTPRIDQAPLVRTMPARALTTLQTEIGRAKTHFGLPAGAPVQSCYEAGRDGFWLHRYLVSRRIANSIVDSSSHVPSDRRAMRRYPAVAFPCQKQIVSRRASVTVGLSSVVPPNEITLTLPMTAPSKVNIPATTAAMMAVRWSFARGAIRGGSSVDRTVYLGRIEEILQPCTREE